MERSADPDAVNNEGLRPFNLMFRDNPNEDVVKFMLDINLGQIGEPITDPELLKKVTDAVNRGDEEDSE